MPKYERTFFDRLVSDTDEGYADFGEDRELTDGAGNVEENAAFDRAVEQAASLPTEKTTNVDWGFIREQEGFRTKLYVPTDEDGKAIEQSGVTVGSGVDLGQWNKKQFEDLGVPESTINKLLPYFGIRKQAAIDLLALNPLELGKEEAEELTDIIKRDAVAKVAKKYNAASNTDFEDLHPKLQTVITSVAFQYGDLKGKAPNFWRQITGGDFKAAYNNLRNFEDDYGPRRGREADYIKNLIVPPRG
jgi:hypothetical protein